MKQVAVYISGKSSRLMKYLNGNSSYNSKKKIKAVFSDEYIDDALKEELDKHEIIYEQIDYKSGGNNTTERRLFFSNKLLLWLENYKIDYCISFGSHILCGALLEKYKNKIINFHPSILPMYKGVRAIDQAAKQGNTLLVGNTAHFVDEGVDTGLIIMQSVIPIQKFLENNNYDTILDLQLEMMEKILKLLDEERILINDNRVYILGADYSSYNIYPRVGD